MILKVKVIYIESVNGIAIPALSSHSAGVGVRGSVWSVGETLEHNFLLNIELKLKYVKILGFYEQFSTDLLPICKGCFQLLF